MPIRPRSGSALAVAPEEVVVEFLGRRLLEAVDLAALRIHARHDVLDRAVLAGGVHRLEDDQHRIAVVGVEQFLRVAEILAARVEIRLGAFPSASPSSARISPAPRQAGS